MPLAHYFAAGRLPAATIGKVGAVWRNLFGADKQPALAEAVENGVLQSQLPRPRRLTLRRVSCDHGFLSCVW